MAKWHDCLTSSGRRINGQLLDGGDPGPLKQRVSARPLALTAGRIGPAVSAPKIPFPGLWAVP